MSAPAHPPAPSRDAAIDHLRIGLTVLVILHHVAISYGGSGGWYWREQPNASQPLLILFNATNQSYFMGFFFLLAGYYTPAAFDRKGPGRFLAERFHRLGVPLVVYFFFISTLTIALDRTSRGHAFWSGWWLMIREREFGPGPLWFAEALLLFAAAYAIWRRLRPAPAAPATCHVLRDIPRSASPSLPSGPAPAVCHVIRDNAPGSLPSVRSLALIALALGAANFLVRLALPVGQNVLWLQLGYFPCYIFLFAAGCAAARSQLLERIAFRDARPWLIISTLAWLVVPVLIVARPFRGAFEGGWNLNALLYACWDPFVGAGAILGLLWAARTWWSRATPLTAWLARHAYGAFIVHPPVAVGLGLLATALPLPPLAKFALVGAAASAASFLVAALFRAIPGAAKIL